MQRASSGTLGVCCDMLMIEAGKLAEQAKIGTGDEADDESAVGLILRVLTLWLLLLASLVGC